MGSSKNFYFVYDTPPLVPNSSSAYAACAARLLRCVRAQRCAALRRTAGVEELSAECPLYKSEECLRYLLTDYQLNPTECTNYKFYLRLNKKS